MDVLGGACHDSLQSLNLSLDLLRILLAHHVLLVEAAIVQAVGVVEEMLGLVVLEKMGGICQLPVRWSRSSKERQAKPAHLVIFIPAAIAEAGRADAHDVGPMGKIMGQQQAPER